MRWIKFIIIILALSVGLYAGSMYFVDESKSFSIEKEIPYPIEKVYPQFSNFQNFTRWNEYFSKDKNYSVAYYEPYEGQGAAMSFQDKKTKKNGDMFIRYENPYQSLRYQLFEADEENPYQIDVKFKRLSDEKTKVIWLVKTPKQPWLERTENLWTETEFIDNIGKSIKNLVNILGNKVDKDQLMATIKYDSLMVEEQAEELLLGMSVSTTNKSDGLIKNIVQSHNKISNFVSMDLGKNEDEYGFPVLLTDANNYKDKEVSYYYGIPLSKKTTISDNNFNFRNVKSSKEYVIYYQGNYKNRIKSIQILLQKAKKDTMKYGELKQTFIVPPSENGEVNMKIALPVYR
ncbi:MAG: polyketide cyclase [Bergeyella zoohelcum]|nr:polyketide cyclase [Bergeyella zoohelcum]